jgi:hypothetical protein
MSTEQPYSFGRLQWEVFIAAWLPTLVLGFFMGKWMSEFGTREHLSSLILRGVIFAVPLVLLAANFARGWFVPAVLYLLSFRVGYQIGEDSVFATSAFFGSIFGKDISADTRKYSALVWAREVEMDCFMVAGALASWLAAKLAPKLRMPVFFKSIADEVDDYERMKRLKRHGE